jgi:hypothetical protein
MASDILTAEATFLEPPRLGCVVFPSRGLDVSPSRVLDVSSPEAGPGCVVPRGGSSTIPRARVLEVCPDPVLDVSRSGGLNIPRGWKGCDPSRTEHVLEPGTEFTVGMLGGLYRQSASPKLPNSPPNGGRIRSVKV